MIAHQRAKTSRRPWRTGKCTSTARGERPKGPHTPIEPRPEVAGRGGGGRGEIGRVVPPYHGQMREEPATTVQRVWRMGV